MSSLHANRAKRSRTAASTTASLSLARTAPPRKVARKKETQETSKREDLRNYFKSMSAEEKAAAVKDILGEEAVQFLPAPPQETKEAEAERESEAEAREAIEGNQPSLSIDRQRQGASAAMEEEKEDEEAERKLQKLSSATEEKMEIGEEEQELQAAQRAQERNAAREEESYGVRTLQRINDQGETEEWRRRSQVYLDETPRTRSALNAPPTSAWLRNKRAPMEALQAKMNKIGRIDAHPISALTAATEPQEEEETAEGDFVEEQAMPSPVVEKKTAKAALELYKSLGSSLPRWHPPTKEQPLQRPWLQQFERMMEAYADFLPSSDWWRLLPLLVDSSVPSYDFSRDQIAKIVRERPNFEDLCLLMSGVFDKESDEQALQDDFVRLRQRYEESAKNYNGRFRKLMEQLGYSDEAAEHTPKYVHSLRDDLRTAYYLSRGTARVNATLLGGASSKLVERIPLRQVMLAVEQIEYERERSSIKSNRSENSLNYQGASGAPSTPGRRRSMSHGKYGKKPGQKTCSVHGVGKHGSEECYQLHPELRRSSGGQGRGGYERNKRPTPSSPRTPGGPPSSAHSSSATKGSMRCYRCNQEGHIAPNCPSAGASTARPAAPPSTPINPWQKPTGPSSAVRLNSAIRAIRRASKAGQKEALEPLKALLGVKEEPRL